MRWFRNLFGKDGGPSTRGTAKVTSQFRCQHCGRDVISHDRLEEECAKHGILLINGNMMGGDLSKSPIAQHLEDSKGFRCLGCRTIYCMSCLYNHAPSHQNGGKACPTCNDKFDHLYST